jgi:hypothetical protein
MNSYKTDFKKEALELEFCIMSPRRSWIKWANRPRPHAVEDIFEIKHGAGMKSVWGVGTMSMISRFWATYAMNTGFQFTVEASKQTYTSIHVGRYRLTYTGRMY